MNQQQVEQRRERQFDDHCLVLTKWKNILPAQYYMRLEAMIKNLQNNTITKDQFKQSLHALVEEMKQEHPVAKALLPQRKLLVQQYVNNLTDTHAKSLIDQYYNIRTLVERGAFVARNREIVPHLRIISEQIKATTPIMLQHVAKQCERITMRDHAALLQAQRPSNLEQRAAKRRRTD